MGVKRAKETGAAKMRQRIASRDAQAARSLAAQERRRQAAPRRAKAKKTNAPKVGACEEETSR